MPPRGLRIFWAVFGAAALAAVPLAAHAQLPKAPEPPKTPEAPKAPEVKTPEKPKQPEVEVPDLPAGAEEEAPPEEDALPPELTGAARQSPVKVEEAENSAALTIEEIVNSLVQTASNRSESQLTAPAWIITISADELEARGYRELTDLFDDLPGMDVSRPWGDTYFKVYWRGYRNTIGAPYLLMVDGMIFNHLWLNEAEIMAAFPLSNIDRVEIVYGPASAVYGPNAAMGVVNVITKKKGSHTRARVAFAAPQRTISDLRAMTKIIDGSVLYDGDGYTLAFSAGVNFGVLDPSIGENFEWTKTQYYRDRKLWGDFVDFPAIAGEFRSPSEKQAIDLRIYVGSPESDRGETEVAAQLYRMKNGAGVVYPADRFQANALYTMLEESIYLRHVHQLTPAISSTSILRYRISNIDSPTTDLERITSPFDPQPAQPFPTGRPVDGTTTAMDQTGTSTTCVGVASPCVRYQYWASANSSITAQQDFNSFIGQNVFADDDKLYFDFGLKYERKDLERRYIRSGGDWDPNVSFNEDPVYRFPAPINADDNVHNRNQVDVFGAYMLATYNLYTEHYIYLGLRIDYDAILGEVAPTFRGGYVGRFFEDFTLKVLYGQAVQEPTWRDLFGAWNGSGANPGLKSERSQTAELNLSYKIDWLVLQGDIYIVEYTNAIISTTDAGQNLGRRLISGADLSVTALISIPKIRALRLWAYYSPYLFAKESPRGGAPGADLVDIGDLAKHKLLLGATLELNRYFAATALGRCIADRTTVATNPLRSTPEYCALDANIQVRDLIATGISLSAKVYNILDTQYFHPGIQDADSGNTPGRWEGDVWIGSGGYNNSYLPQPGRSFMIQLALDL